MDSKYNSLRNLFWNRLWIWKEIPTVLYVRRLSEISSYILRITYMCLNKNLMMFLWRYLEPVLCIELPMFRQFYNFILQRWPNTKLLASPFYSAQAYLARVILNTWLVVVAEYAIISLSLYVMMLKFSFLKDENWADN